VGGAVLAVFAIPIGLSVLERLREYFDGNALANCEKNSGEASIRIVGRPLQIRRVLMQANTKDLAIMRFRVGLSVEQQYMLIVLSLGVLPLLRLFGLTSITLATIYAVAFVMAVFLAFCSRVRYTIDHDQLVTEHLCGWRVNHRNTQTITGAQVCADFAEGTLDIRGPCGSTCVNLRELFYPHQFVAYVVAVAASTSRGSSSG
jgi:hypothetical protein